jgi:hypothetical protein
MGAGLIIIRSLSGADYYDAVSDGGGGNTARVPIQFGGSDATRSCDHIKLTDATALCATTTGAGNATLTVTGYTA